MRLTCASCGTPTSLTSTLCASCPGCLDYRHAGTRLHPERWSGRGLSRYAPSLCVPPAGFPSLGEGGTRLVEGLGPGISLKMESESATGSFKDRGAVLAVGWARAADAARVLEDSSGNAGLAVATYAQAAGLPATILVPADAPAGKVSAIRATRATLRLVEGDRPAVAAAARAMALERGTYYASHILGPWFLEASRTIAFELWEALGPDLCDRIVLPVGHGTMLIGLHRGLAELAQAGLSRRTPRLVAGQAQGYAPLAPGPASKEVNDAADGIRIRQPNRLVQMQQALAATGGRAVVVGRQATLEAMKDLHARGVAVEATSALAWQAARQDDGAAGSTVVIMTGRFKG